MVKTLCLIGVLYSANSFAGIKGRLKAKVAIDDYRHFILSIAEGKSLPTLGRKVKTLDMDQKEKAFAPRVLGIKKGDTVRFENKDDIFHNVFSLNPVNKFDLGVFKGKTAFKDDKETPVKGEPKVAYQFKGVGKTHVFCNIHQDMQGTLFVFDHDYFVTPAKNGQFELPSLPNGKYTLEIQSTLLKKKLKVRFTSPRKKPLILKFDALEEEKSVDHKMKNGKEYKEDYGDEDFY